MKILKIAFENLNSLAGKWEIDLTHPDYRDGLFLISGETGAGKTTILDAITLAFFGRTARLDVSSEHDEVMTHGEGRCSATVEFSCEERADAGRLESARYRAGWSHARTRANARNPYGAPKRTLAKFDAATDTWTEVSGTLTELEKRTAQLIGVSGEKKADWFDQFLRTAMLAQGKFDQFLQSDGKVSDKQRSQILEQATGTAIYSKIGDAVNRRKKELADRLEKREAERKGAAAQTLADARVDWLKRRLAQHAGFGSWLERRIAALEAESAWHRDADALNAEAEQIAAQEKALAVHRKQSEPALARADKAQAARRIQREHDTWAAAVAHEEKSCGDVARSEQELNDAVERRRRAETAVVLARATCTAARTALDAKTPAIERALVLDVEIRTRNGRLDVLRMAAESARQAVARAETFLAESEAFIADQVTAAGNARSAAASEPVELVERTQALAGLDAVRQEKAAARDAAETEYANRIDDLLQAVKLAEDDLRAAQRVRSYEEARRHLEDGAACPLCGSGDHPFCHGLVRTPDEYEVRLRDAQGRRDELTARRDAARRTFDEADGKFRSAERALEALRADWRRQAEANRSEAAACEARADERRRQAEKTADELPGLKAAATEAVAASEEMADAVEKLRAERVACGVAGDPNGVRAELRKAVDASGQAEATAQVELASAEATVRAKTENREHLRKVAQDAAAAQVRAREIFAAAREKMGYADTDAWRAACWNDRDLQDAEEMRGKIEHDASGLDALKKNLAEKRADFSRREPSSRARDVVENALQAARGRRERIVRQITEKETILRKDEADRKTVADLDAQIGTLREQALKWKDLDREIGGENGANFKLYAQGVTLARLIELGNKYLYPMSNRRYEMFWDGEGADAARLLPTIVDRKARDEKRPIVNLSGGEKFQVSLALALGLSELNSGTLNVETLFLDEGFGTLDEKTLDLSIQTLEGLQRDGAKTIGIISHVHELELRPMTKIVATKVGQGTSELSGPGVAHVSN